MPQTPDAGDTPPPVYVPPAAIVPPDNATPSDPVLLSNSFRRSNTRGTRRSDLKVEKPKQAEAKTFIPLVVTPHTGETFSKVTGVEAYFVQSTGRYAKAKYGLIFDDAKVQYGSEPSIIIANGAIPNVLDGELVTDVLNVVPDGDGNWVAVAGSSPVGFCDIISGSGQSYIGFITTTPGGSTEVGGSAEDPMADPNTLETGAVIKALNLLVGSLDLTLNINYLIAHKFGDEWHIEPSGMARIGFAALGSGSGKDYNGTIRTLGGGLGEVIQATATIRAENLNFGSISGDDYLAHLVGEVWHVQPSTF